MDVQGKLVSMVTSRQRFSSDHTGSDVSRNSEISLQCYLRSGESQVVESPGKDGQGDDVMGMGDIYLGGVKFVPNFENQVSSSLDLYWILLIDSRAVHHR